MKEKPIQPIILKELKSLVCALNNDTSLSSSPSCDSPIEEIFVYNIEKYLKKDVTVIPQYEVPTSIGNFRLDFALKTNVKKIIGIECDGKEFHKDYAKDEFRDTFILGESDVAEIIRFTGKEINFYIEICLFFLAEYHPELFTHKGKLNIETLAHNRRAIIRKHERIYARWEFEPEVIYVEYLDYRDKPYNGRLTSLPVLRRFKSYKGNLQYWQGLYHFAIHNTHIKDIYEIKKEYEDCIMRGEFNFNVIRELTE